MSTKTDICNMALVHLGQGTISSIDEDSEAARKCKLIYDNLRDTLLMEAAWPFAKVIEALVAISDETPPSNWNYVYARPSKCLYIRKIFCDPANTNPEPEEFDEVYLTDKNIEAIYALNGQPNTAVFIEYTYQITDDSQFSSHFVKAFSHKLASNLANPLTGDSVKGDKQEQLYRDALSEAARLGANETNLKKRRQNTYEDSRQGTSFDINTGRY